MSELKNKDVVDIVEVDLESNAIVVDGEENFKAIESLLSKSE